MPRSAARSSRTALVVVVERPGDLGENEDDFGAGIEQRALDDVDRGVAHDRQRNRRLFEFAIPSDIGRFRIRRSAGCGSAARHAAWAAAKSGEALRASMRMPPTTSATTPSMAEPACGFSAASRCAHGARRFVQQHQEMLPRDVRAQPHFGCQRVVAGRAPDQGMRKPASENRAPTFLTTECTTSRSPRSTRTSVTASLSVGRCAMANRCCWLLLLLAVIRSRSSSRGDWARTGLPPRCRHRRPACGSRSTARWRSAPADSPAWRAPWPRWC